jgi:acetate kinase
MKKVLVLNCGSSSIKYTLFDEALTPIAHGKVSRIGERGPSITHTYRGKTIKKRVDASDHRRGLRIVMDYLTNQENGAIRDKREIRVVGHRVVHGGELSRPTIITPKVRKLIRSYFDLAPLHNPPNLKGIDVAMKLLPRAKHVAIFDTAFHTTLPEEAYYYGIPLRYYEKYGIRRYGFHGTSHEYVAREAARMLRIPFKRLNCITCHLGAGSSITAVRNGESVDTSMGFTPLEGVMMGTRCGDIDASLFHFLQHKGMGVDDVYAMLNNKSGLLGVSGESKDVGVLLKSRAKRARLALDMFAYRVKKYIGAYSAVLGRVDAVVFTAGIGENAPTVRAGICGGLERLGIALDPKKNKANKPGVISKGRVRVVVVPTNEELSIAKQAMSVVGK